MSLSNPEYSRSTLLRPIDISSPAHGHKAGTAALMLMAIGVVFGDIGTSPLYAIKACFDPLHGVAITPASVMGVLSLIVWAFVLIVSVKYVVFIMRASNHGEGGILALMALAMRAAPSGSRKSRAMLFLGVFGACLFYGDAVITPAISVLSAIEGTTVVSPIFERTVIPLTLAILILLFAVQRRGTAVVGNLFGPVMLVWFLTLAAMGLWQLRLHPEVLAAVNPLYAVRFMTSDLKVAFLVIGSVFLVVTGTEALYADMGHFGLPPIRYAWFGLVMPSLLLNYFGQGAMLLANPATIDNPFFLMVPGAFTLALVVLSTAATVIASQACISGAYSMTSQAILLGLMPRMNVVHTSDSEVGQIYVPFVNWMLCLVVIGVVIAFQKSENLAAAYGIAVSTTMLMTTVLAFIVMRHGWQWPTLKAALISGVFCLVDLVFLVSNSTKIIEGGWFPLLMGGVIFLLIMTWYQGRNLLRQRAIAQGVRIPDFLAALMQDPPYRVEGTAIFLTAHIDFVPSAILHNLKHNKVLHQRVIFLKMSVWDVPFVKREEKLAVEALGHQFYLVRAIFGFKEQPDINEVLALLAEVHGLRCERMDTSFFMAKDSLVARDIPQMTRWRENLFIWMMQNARRASDFFKIDSGRLIELGAKIEL